MIAKPAAWLQYANNPSRQVRHDRSTTGRQLILDISYYRLSSVIFIPEGNGFLDTQQFSVDPCNGCTGGQNEQIANKNNDDANGSAGGPVKFFEQCGQHECDDGHQQGNICGIFRPDPADQQHVTAKSNDRTEYGQV